MFKTIRENTTLTWWEFIFGSVLVGSASYVFVLLFVAIG